MEGIIAVILGLLIAFATAVFAAALFLDLVDRKEIWVFVDPTPRGVKIFLMSVLGIGTIIFIVSIIYDFLKIIK